MRMEELKKGNHYSLNVRIDFKAEAISKLYEGRVSKISGYAFFTEVVSLVHKNDGPFYAVFDKLATY